MKFYTKTHAHFCGIDLYARCLYVCILDAAGETRLHMKIPASPRSDAPAYPHDAQAGGTAGPCSQYHQSIQSSAHQQESSPCL